MSLAARQTGLTPAAVSASLRRLERELGTRIFERSTRSLRVTDEGGIILEGCEEVIQRWQQTIDELRAESAELQGVVRISAPGDAAYQFLAPAIMDLATQHPALQIILHCADALHHLQREAIDLAIRYGRLQDSQLTARKLSQRPSILVASPGYLESAPPLNSPSDLEHHRTITLQLGERVLERWTLTGREGEQVVELVRPLCVDGHLARRWALEGHGIAFKALIDVIDDLEQGRLVNALPAYVGETVPVHIVFPSKEHLPARVRAVEEVLRGVLKERDARCEAWLLAKV